MPRTTPINLPSFHQLTRPGFSGWRILLLALLAVFFTGPGQIWGTSAYVDPMLEDLDMSRALYSVGTRASAALPVIAAVAVWFARPPHLPEPNPSSRGLVADPAD